MQKSDVYVRNVYEENVYVLECVCVMVGSPKVGLGESVRNTNRHERAANGRSPLDRVFVFVLLLLLLLLKRIRYNYIQAPKTGKKERTYTKRIRQSAAGGTV